MCWENTDFSYRKLNETNKQKQTFAKIMLHQSHCLHNCQMQKAHSIGESLALPAAVDMV
jgi:hypothetical protein